MNDIFVQHTNRNTKTEKQVSVSSSIIEVVEMNKQSNIMIHKKIKYLNTDTDTGLYHSMFLHDGSNRTKVTYNGTNFNLACHGTFELVGCQHRLHYREQPSPQNLYVILQITTPAREQISVTLSMKAFCNIQSLMKTLEEAHISIDKKYLKIWLRDNVPKIGEFTPTTKMIGWWRDEHEKLFTDNEEEFRKGYESGFNWRRIPKYLGVFSDSPMNCQAVMFASALLVDDLMPMLYTFGIKHLARVCIGVNDTSETAFLLKQVMPDIVHIQANDSDSESGQCPVILIDTYSTYLKNKMISQSADSPDNFSIIITEKHFSDLSNDLADRVLCIDCGVFQLKEYVPLRSWFVVKMLDNVAFINLLLNKYNKYIDRFKDFAKSSIANTAALLMAISDTILINLEESWRTKLIAELEEYIMQALDGSLADASAAFVDYLCTKRDIPVVTKEQFDESQEQLLVIDDDVYFTRQTMEHIAKLLRMRVKTLCNILKGTNLLQAKSGFQKAVNVNGRTLWMYNLRQSDIFRKGDIMFEIDGFSNAEPQLRLNLGKNNSTSVYYAVNALDGSENGHVMITGNTRTGKSTLLANVARRANRAGIKVVCIGSSYSRLSLSGDEVSVHQYFDEPQTYLLSDVLSGINKEYLISDEQEWLELLMEEAKNGKQYSSLAECEHEILSMIDNNECSMLIKQVKNIIESEAKSVDWNEVLTDNRISIIEVEDEVNPDSALAEFYTHKVRCGDNTPCILILDECQEFSMNSKSPLVKVLRQGAKQGIMAFLSTQYLSQDNGSDAVKIQSLCQTKVVFRPVKTVDALKQLGSSAEDSKLRELLDSLGKGECLVMGSISTDKCYIDYPVKVTVPGQI